MKKQIQTMAEYNSWANQKFCSLLSSVSETILTQEVSSSFPTIERTLFHIWAAEFIWLARLKNNSFNTWPGKSPEEKINFENFLETGKKIIELIKNSSEDYFSDTCQYKNISGEPFSTENGKILFHVFNHSTFHRGQLVTQLRNQGFKDKIESTDLISYLRIC